MRTRISLFHVGVWVVACSQMLPTAKAASASDAAPLTTFARLPIREITVFKDGHAFVAHEGELPTDKSGNVQMDYLPTPVIGTFWPYSADKRAKLTSVTAGLRRVRVERTAIAFRELLEGNIGAEVVIGDQAGNHYAGTIRDIPRRSSEELIATSPPNAAERLPEPGNLLLLQTAEGTRTIDISRVQDVTFKGRYQSTSAVEEFRNLLTLKLDWARSAPAKSARVGLFYLQKGIRWIPNYKVDIDGNGNARVKLQATLINELADLEDVSANLVVGVPTFAFKDTVDPMALQQNLAQLSQYFQTDASARNNPFASQFSNAIMSQSVRASEYYPAPAMTGSGALGPEIADTGKTEDQFVYTVNHLSLRKGERMVLPIAEFTIPYRDVFTLDLPVAPPPEIRGNFGSDQQRDLARLLASPKVMHKIRLTNDSSYPLTTAPALIVRGGRVLAQGMMTYTPIGAHSDLAVTAAVDFQVNKTEKETKRTPNAITENGYQYSRIDLEGKVSITSHRADAVEVEVTRFILGIVDRAGGNATIEKINPFEDGDYRGGDYSYGWGWSNWPYWWGYLNGIARVNWKVSLEPKHPADLNYEWHYFWR